MSLFTLYILLEKTLESPLDCKEIQPVQYFGHLMQRADSSSLPDTGRDWGQEKKGTTEDEMVGWHYQLNGPGFG